jgi:hypothetical protein
MDILKVKQALNPMVEPPTTRYLQTSHEKEKRTETASDYYYTIRFNLLLVVFTSPILSSSLTAPHYTKTFFDGGAWSCASSPPLACRNFLSMDACETVSSALFSFSST